MCYSEKKCITPPVISVGAQIIWRAKSLKKNNLENHTRLCHLWKSPLYALALGGGWRKSMSSVSVAEIFSSFRMRCINRQIKENPMEFLTTGEVFWWVGPYFLCILCSTSNVASCFQWKIDKNLLVAMLHYLHICWSVFIYTRFWKRKKKKS